MTGQVPQTYTGKDIEVWIGLKGEPGKTHTELGIGELTITLDRGTVDRGLLGETGNFRTQGALSITGSLTAAKLSDGTAGIFLKSIIDGVSDSRVWISGQIGECSLHFHFTEVMITSSGIEVGDASTISDGSFDFQIMNPVDLQKTDLADGGVLIEC